MKKTVLTFGLIAGAAAVLLMAVSAQFIRAHRLGAADVIGYTSMGASALVVFLGIRAYRNAAGGGRITFARALGVGVLITLVSSACYVVAFEILYFGLLPDFGQTLSACMVERAREGGATAPEIERVVEQARVLKRLYDHPLTNAGVSFATTFPLGLAFSALSAAILRRR